jgi:hypothetical protein
MTINLQTKGGTITKTTNGAAPVSPEQNAKSEEYHTIYLWSTERYQETYIRKRDGKPFPPIGKVGETDTEADIRIAQTDSTGVAEKPLKLLELRVPKWLTDKMIHSLLKQKGYPKHRDDKDREFIYFTDCETPQDMIDVVKRTINERWYGKSAIANWPLFDYQIDIVNWAVDKIKEADRLGEALLTLLIDAVMRAGKCPISYMIIKRLGYKKILITTGKPGAIASWSALPRGGDEEHVEFRDFIFHDYKTYKNKTIKFGEGECDIMAVSLQYAKKHIDSGTNPLLNQILDTQWDLHLEDEQHYAGQTEKTKKFREKTKTKKRIELSGTPYKTLISGRIPKEYTKSFDYIDEQRIRQLLLAINDPNCEQTRQFRYRARQNYRMIRIPDKVKQHCNDENFNLGARGIFATDKKQLQYPSAVRELIDVIKKVAYKELPPKFKKYAGVMTRHQVWRLPKNILAIICVAKMLKQHPYFKKYKIIRASGSGKEDELASVKRIDEIKGIIQGVESGKSDYIGTITLTCGRFLEGTTVPEWWIVNQINSSQSAEDYFQCNFRNKSPNEKDDKQEVLVNDFDPERCVKTMWEHIERTADDKGRNPEEAAIEFMECSDVYDYAGDDLKLINGEILYKKYLSNIENVTTKVCNFVNADLITNEMKSILADKEEDSNSVSAQAQLNQNDVKTGSNQRRSNNKGNTPPATDVDYAAKIRYALKQVFELVVIAWNDGHNINTLDDMINYKDLGKVYEITGLTPKEWGTLIPAINHTGMNRAIGQFNHNV